MFSPELMEEFGFLPGNGGIDPEELYERIHPDDVRRNRERVEKMYQGEDELYETELRIKVGEGRWKWFYNRGKIREKDKDGKPLMIAGICLDISGEFSQLLERVEETERLYKLIFESANDRIGLYTLKGEPILYNTAFYNNLGYNEEEFLALDQHTITHPEDKSILETAAIPLLEKGYVSNEYRVRHKKGHYLTMSSRAVLIRSDGMQDRVLFIMRDITAQKKVIRELKEAKDKAEESDKLKSAFLANMSHEIRTPMNSIIGFSSLLNKRLLPEKQRALYVQRIISNSENLLTLISDIIDLAKIESDQLPIIFGKVRIRDLISEMDQYAREEVSRMGKKKLKIICSLSDRNCELEIDALRISQVMKNLINNAIKFTDKGSIEIGCDEDEMEHKVRFYVKDTGIGIAPGHTSLIFEQFRQIDGSDTRKFGGTGLGLAICKNLTQIMGGEIWVESAENKGTTFYLEFSVKSTGAIVVDDDAGRPAKETALNEKSMDILVVDDEPDALELFREFLELNDHKVRTALNGYEALRMLEQYPLPDVILMDIQMPVLSGTDTLRIIRQRYNGIKVVAQSAYALAGDRDRFLAEGYDDYLPKPFTREQLDRVVNAVS